MRRLTLQYVENLVKQGPKLVMDRRPMPMPGRKWPTHVAWLIQLGDRHVHDDGHGHLSHKSSNVRTLSYVGKPCLYRALQARKFLKQLQGPNTILLRMWQAEFDRAGLVAYKLVPSKTPVSCAAFYAYHPHSTQVDVVEAFSKPVFVKYIGGMRVYSQKKKLAQEAVDAYYEWYQQNFKRRLRRPKPVASAVIAGASVELTEQQPQQ